MTKDQKLADFRNLADTIAKNYAPYEWKKQILPDDPLAIGLWLDRVAQTQTDAEFWDICSEYVASLRDSHSFFVLPSTFSASLGFTVDVYEGKILIDSIDRGRLPEAEFPFTTGDELSTVDGRPADELVGEYSKLLGEGNARTQLRGGASFITRRDQLVIPRAYETPDSSEVTVKRESGETGTYRIQWKKEGIPVTAIPNSPEVRTAAAVTLEALLERLPPRKYRNWRVADKWVVGVGNKQPVFALPTEGFTQRLGAAASDQVVSGVFTSGGRQFGYLRLPQFSSSRMVTQAQQEIRFFRGETEGAANTDGLILDLTRNPGGSVCSVDDILPHLMPDGYAVFTAEFRVTWLQVLELRDTLLFLKSIGASDEDILEVELYLQSFEESLKAGKPRSSKLPGCGTDYQKGPALDRVTREVIAYRKPLVVLTDEFTFSAAEVMASLLQDTGRATIVGARTAGAGGAVSGVAVGVYSEAQMAITIALGYRGKDIVSDDLPTAPLIENIGIRPDIAVDYMTRENLVNKGKPYLDRVLEIINSKIQ